MLQEMQIRNYSECSIRSYIHCLSRLSIYYNCSPDLLSIDQVKSYLHYYYQQFRPKNYLFEGYVAGQAISCVQARGKLTMLLCIVAHRHWVLISVYVIVVVIKRQVTTHVVTDIAQSVNT